MGITEVLSGIKKIGLDTPVFIYYIEENKKYIDIVDYIFNEISSDKRGLEVVASTVTLLEVLVNPIKTGNIELAQRYERLLLHSRHLTIYPLTSEVAIKSANLRAKYNLRTPDVIQIAVAILEKANIFFTNDSALKKVTEIPIVILDELLK
ncbi:PIN domain-containing protein [Patescibacteria group bacterium]|nr:PIN domain-containing protein [Bacteroidota bacterium]MBU1967528.1 PIN domain-containing protein [Patescibacteria group bacterium]